MNRTLLLLTSVVILAGCENPYSKYYQDSTGGINVLQDSHYIISNEPPQLIQGSELDKDYKRMLEDGYCPLGSSSFWGGEINQNDALKQAKKIHACTVIIYSKYKETVSGVAPMSVPATQTSYHSGSVYGSGGIASYSGTSTTYGTNTMFMPYQFNRYDYFAGYWIKRKPPRLGVYLDDLTDELRQKIKSNKGLYVLAVVKGTSAYNNDILSGDIIRRINGKEIIDFDSLHNVLNGLPDQEVEVELFRDDQLITKKIQLHS